MVNLKALRGMPRAPATPVVARAATSLTREEPIGTLACAATPPTREEPMGAPEVHHYEGKDIRPKKKPKLGV
ncbi:hypothetical protein BHM03_00016892 [Ensete ventricosum]|nr:hypothetical protein BHM03_00016892 [Ensete ventricosum]